MHEQAETRQRIIDTARELISARSYHAVGVAEICRQAGAQKGSFYHYFPSKRALALTALDQTSAFFRKAIINSKGDKWFKEKFLHVLTPITILALLITLALLFSFKGEVIVSNPLTILWIAIPLFIQTNLIYWLGYGLARWLKLDYRDAAPAAMIGASNHFEVAIATSTMLFGLSSGAALATVVGVLIEVPVMLMLVRVCLRTQGWFAQPS